MEGLKKGRQAAECQTIVGVNFDAPQSNYFLFECDGEIYAMGYYDTIYLCADANHADQKKTPFLLMHKDDMIVPVKKKETESQCGG